MVDVGPPSQLGYQNFKHYWSKIRSSACELLTLMDHSFLYIDSSLILYDSMMQEQPQFG